MSNNTLTHVHTVTHVHTITHVHTLTRAVRPDMSEMTALGAAIAAGVGAGVWRDVTQFPRQHVSQFDSQIKSDGKNVLLWIFLLLWNPTQTGTGAMQDGRRQSNGPCTG